MEFKEINFNRIKAIFLKEFIHIKRDARSLVITLIAPIVLLILYGYAVTFDIKRIDLGVVDYDNSKQSRDLISKFMSSSYFEIYTEGFNDMNKNLKAIRINRIRAILVIPYDFAKSIKKGRTTKIQLIIDGSDANTANIALNYAKIIAGTFASNMILERINEKGINAKTIPRIEPIPRIWFNPELKSVNFIVPGLIAILMMLIAATLTSLTVIREKERGSFEQLISTPAKPLELMLGKLMPYVIIGCVDVILVTLAGLLWFKVPFKGNIFTFSLFTLLFIFCAMGQGLFMSSIAKNQTVAVIATVFSTILPSMLLSGFVFPIDSMPWIIRILTYIVPAKYFLTALRSIFLKEGAGLAILYREAIFLFVFGTIFLFLAAKKFKKKLE
jgi:ABC-2 type transport system permease protein